MNNEVFCMQMQTTLAKHTVNEKGIEGGFREQEFQEKMRRTKIIELTAKLEAKSAHLEALTREKQKVDRERDREVMCSDSNDSVDIHEASDKFIRCAKGAPQISIARHQSVVTNTTGSAHDDPEGGEANTKVGFFKSLAQSIRTKREEARQRQEILELLLIE
jgi:hypothetical protein